MSLLVFGSGFGRPILELRNGSGAKLVMISTSWKDRIGPVLGGLTGQKIVSDLIGATKQTSAFTDRGSYPKW